MLQKLETFTKRVSDLADKPYMTSTELKAYFDAAPDEVRQYLNKLIDALQSSEEGDSGAQSIGVSPVEGVPGLNVQEMLANLKAAIDQSVMGQIPDGSISIQKLDFSAETTAGAQGKANTAESNAKAYADTKFATHSSVDTKISAVTSQKINVISPINSANYLNVYPYGLTVFAGTLSSGYFHYSTVFTIKVDNDRGVQYAFDRVNGTMQTRYWTGSFWSPWDPDNRLWIELNRTGLANFNAQTMTKVTFDNSPNGRQTINWNNDKFTAPKKGIYLFNLAAAVRDLSQFAALELYMYKNGVNYKKLNKVIAPGSTSMTATGNISMELNGGETIEFYIYCTEADALYDGTFLTITQLA